MTTSHYSHQVDCPLTAQNLISNQTQVCSTTLVNGLIGSMIIEHVIFKSVMFVYHITTRRLSSKLFLITNIDVFDKGSTTP